MEHTTVQTIRIIAIKDLTIWDLMVDNKINLA